MRKLVVMALTLLVGTLTGAAGLKYSDRDKVDKAVEAIKMADLLAASTPETIRCQVIPVEGPIRFNRIKPEVVLQSGTQAFTNLLAAMTTKLNNDKTAAEAYLASVGVTND